MKNSGFNFRTRSTKTSIPLSSTLKPIRKLGEGHAWVQHSDVSLEPPSSLGILKCWRQMVTGSNPAKSLGNLYSAIFSRFSISKSHHVSRLIWTLAFVHPPWASSINTVFKCPDLERSPTNPKTHPQKPYDSLDWFKRKSAGKAYILGRAWFPIDFPWFPFNQWLVHDPSLDATAGCWSGPRLHVGHVGSRAGRRFHSQGAAKRSTVLCEEMERWVNNFGPTT